MGKHSRHRFRPFSFQALESKVCCAADLTINEVLATNATGLTTQVRWTADEGFMPDQNYDWLELYNRASQPIDLGRMYLSDDRTDPAQWRFPVGTTIPAGGYLVVFASGQNITDPQLDRRGYLHASFRIGNEGEHLVLTDEFGQVIHEIAVPKQVADVSYGFAADQLRYFTSPTPGAENVGGLLGIVPDVRPGVSRGFFEQPFSLTLTTDDPIAMIRYTLDGSEPTASEGFEYQQPIQIDRTTTLRSAAFRTDYLPSTVSTDTYLFLTDVLAQSPEGEVPAGWPNRPINGQIFNYGMDPDVVNSPIWGPRLRDALTQIPSMSLVVDLDNLFDRATGIYVNASKDGPEFEREASIELIHPNGEIGFQAEAGLRIRGGFSRGGSNPKHSFRLFFRSQYGDARLEYPWFGDEGPDSFQQIDLSTAQNYAWQYGGTSAQRNTFLRDFFSRDTQRDMGQPYKRGRFYHLYLDGQYWGIYHTDERAEADYAESYFGGDEDDYDVIKGDEGVAVATDGNLDSWNRLWQIAKQGFAGDAEYYSVQGKNPDGTDNPNIERHVDIDNLLDYIVLIFYTGNSDAPVTGIGVNNFYAIRSRKMRDAWRFLAHDSELSLISLRDNEVAPVRYGEMRQHFNPLWLHQRLAEHPDYLIRFADRVRKHLFNGGVLSVEANSARWQSRADQIDQAIIAESARWGHVTRTLFTKDDWQKEVDRVLNEYFPGRGEVVVGQLRQQRTFPSISAPTFSHRGGRIPAGLQVELSAPVGEIYYTLDGSDPRLSRGALNPMARRYASDGPITLNDDAVVSARVLSGTEWSALSQADFEIEPTGDATQLRIAEVHYNPGPLTQTELDAGFQDKDEFEFIELVNVYNRRIDLAGAKLVQIADGDGVLFDFAMSPKKLLDAGQRILVVENVDAFRLRYGAEPLIAGQWTGGLGNRAETITLEFAGQVLQQFTYDARWYPRTDGSGLTLEIVSPSSTEPSSWNDRGGWLPSAESGGTPGRRPVALGDANLDGVFSQADLLLVFSGGKYEDETGDNASFVDGDWNGDGDFTTADLVFAMQTGNFG